MPLRPIVRFAGKTAKRGNELADCEDSFAVADLAFAVADGASDGIYSDVWANILTDCYCRERKQHWNDNSFSEWLECRPRAEWNEWQRQVAARDLPWFAREKLRNGTFATFVGITFADDCSGECVAWAYGDACLFVVRNDELLYTIPAQSSAAFNNNPPLVATLRELLPEHIYRIDTLAEPGDSYYLATDALAQWFLAGHERGDKPWIAFDFETASDFDRFVTVSRDEELLRNDDVALICIEARVQE